MARVSPSEKRKERKPLEYVSEHTSKGGLHRSLGIPEGEKIGEKRIRQAIRSKSHKIRKEAQLAETYEKHRPS